MKNFETNQKQWLIEEILDAQNVVSKTCFFSGRGRKQNPPSLFDVRCCGPACQNIVGNHHIRGLKKIAFSYSDPGGTLEKIKQPKTLFSCNKQR